MPELSTIGSMDASALARLIRTHQPCVVLTGAGMSTESGIPDFRSATGIWAEFDPAEYASLRAFRSDPEKVWRFYKPRIAMLTEAEPNAGHFALAALERAGLVDAVVTQNIDLLHERAGTRSLVEVHGSIRTASCPACGESYPRDDVLAQLVDADAPACERCGSILKPDVVFFGELLPAAAIERASELARSASLLLVVGSSLEVHPVAALPEETLLAGGRLAIVNQAPTPYDGRADLKLAGSAGATLESVAAELLRGRPAERTLAE
jgi:NAD-dependent deacetylase